jgi:hypothetical protein
MICGMSSAEIIAELSRLSPADLDLVQAKLRELMQPARSIIQANPTPAQSPRIRSPRLARPEQSKDFVKQIMELAPDAKL